MQTHQRWLVNAIVVLLLSGASACDLNGPELNVEVCGDARIPYDLDAYRIVVLDDSRNTTLREGTAELLKCPGEKITKLPQDIALEGVEEDVWVIVEGLKDGITVSTYEQRVRNPDGDDISVKLALSYDCLGIKCPLGQTCVDAECTLVEYEEPDGICSFSGDPPELPELTFCEPEADMGAI